MHQQKNSPDGVLKLVERNCRTAPHYYAEFFGTQQMGRKSEQVAEAGSQFCGPPVFLRAVSSAQNCELIAFAAADSSIFFSLRRLREKGGGACA